MSLPRLLTAMLFILLASSTLADQTISWDKLDWGLDRGTLVSRYLFHDSQPPSPWQEYLKTLNEGATPSAADLDEFLLLPAAEQDRQRREAKDLHERARSTMMEYAGGLRDAMQDGDANYIGDIMWETPGFAMAVTSAITRLDQAALLDPSSVRIWYDLSYFCDLVGDVNRTERSWLGFMAAHQNMSPDDQKNVDDLWQQVVLDRAWALRDNGHYQECITWLDTHRGQLSREADKPLLAPWVESVLIYGLVKADLGEHHAAKGVLPKLPVLKVPTRTAGVQMKYVNPMRAEVLYAQRFGYNPYNKTLTTTNTTQDLNTKDSRSSDYLRRWVKAWSALRRDHVKQSVIETMGRPMTELDFQPRVARRWWQDQGLIYEQLGEYELARVCWARAAVYRPFFIYYPMGQGNGVSKVHGLEGTGEPYYLAYGTFFTAGSLWSYAANAALAAQVENHPREQALLRETSMAHLDACIRRDLFASEALAARGRLHFLAEAYDLAEADLQQAWQSLDSLETAPADLSLMIGLCSFNREDWSMALPWLKTFVQRSPESHVGWQSLGITQGALNNHDQAIVCLNHAVKLDPDNATYLYNRGLQHYRAGHQIQARQDFNRAHEIWPENAQITQMVQVANEDTIYDLQVATTPVDMDLPEEQRQSLTDLMAVDSTGDLNDLATMDPEAQKALISELRDRYRKEPSEENRLRLAQAALYAGHAELTQDTLLPFWPTGLSPMERHLLLNADRELGHTSLAAEVANDSVNSGQYQDTELLILTAIILMDNDQRELAAVAVNRGLKMDPNSGVLLDINRNLKAVP